MRMAVRSSILLIDDDYNQPDEDDPENYPDESGKLMKVIRRLREEYDVTGVADCDEALELLKPSNAQFSLIILNVQMPIGEACEDLQYNGVLSGVVFAENLRNKYSINLPIVVYTSKPKHGVIWARLSKIGIRDEDFIPKIDAGRDTFPDLKEAVDKHLRSPYSDRKE
jgi:CheY-like chemotaxis protein